MPALRSKEKCLQISPRRERKRGQQTNINSNLRCVRISDSPGELRPRFTDETRLSKIVFAN